MAEQKTIYCPSCKLKLGTYDGRGTIDKIIDCRKCRKRVIYRIATGKTEIKKIPPRSSSSGLQY